MRNFPSLHLFRRIQLDWILSILAWSQRNGAVSVSRFKVLLYCQDANGKRKTFCMGSINFHSIHALNGLIATPWIETPDTGGSTTFLIDHLKSTIFLFEIDKFLIIAMKCGDKFQSKCSTQQWHHTKFRHLLLCSNISRRLNTFFIEFCLMIFFSVINFWFFIWIFGKTQSKWWPFP